MINNLEHKIHILIPFFNADNFLKECIDSILSQNYKNYICYLYDDGSTDNSKNICHDYIKNYGNKFIYLHNQSNLGPAGSKYYGLKYIEKNSFANDIILIIDGDDYLINNALQIINQKYLDTKCWFTYGSCNGKWCEQGDYPPKNNFRKEKWRYSHPRSFKCGLISLFTQNDFQVNNNWLLKGTDRPIVFNCLEWSGYDKIQFINQPIYFYRFYPNNTVNTIDTNIAKSHKEYVNNKLAKNLIEPQIHIIMCSWKRFFNVQKIIDTLDNQTISKNIFLHIINNNTEHINLFKNIKSNNIKINIIHKDNTNFTFEKLLYAKQLYQQEVLDYIIFIDDDQYFEDSNFIEQLYSKKQPKSMITWFGKTFDRLNINYWQNLRNCLKNTIFDYGGIGCAILDCSILNPVSELWNIEDIDQNYNAKKIEDLWLSYVLSLYNWKVINSYLKPDEFLDEETQKYGLWRSLKTEKQKLLEYLILDKKWKLLNDN